MSSSELIKPHSPVTLVDMNPFFQNQYVKNHASDVFETYFVLLADIVLALPCQVRLSSPICISTCLYLFVQCLFVMFVTIWIVCLYVFDLIDFLYFYLFSCILFTDLSFL